MTRNNSFPGDNAIAVKPDTMALVQTSMESTSALHDDAYVDEWIRMSKQKASLNTMIVPLADVAGWQFDPLNGNIRHETGRFFSVIGVHVRHRLDRDELEWDQPIIEQPETGILGIMAKPIHGVLHFCLQAKEEPGNIGNVQLSPTVQATYSNYTGAHGGALPLFLDKFTGTGRAPLLFARLQTEDGGRFLYKSNRNMIVIAGDDVVQELPEGFIWLTLRQIKRLIGCDNLVNACTRSILSTLLAPLAQFDCGCSLNLQGIRETLQWLDECRAANHILARRIGLNELEEWCIDGKGFFSHKEKRFFRIVGLKIACGAREVRSWGQPIIENPAAGIIGLLVKKGADGIELLMQAKAEVGNRNTVQLGPTVQFTQGNYEGSRKLKKPFLYQDFIEQDHFPVLHESCQTEEGARFYREYHRHRILLLPEGAELEPPADFRWLPLQQVVYLLHFGEQVNSCARSILACLP